MKNSKRNIKNFKIKDMRSNFKKLNINFPLNVSKNNTQNKLVFFKKKFGLYKDSNFRNKRLKSNMLFLKKISGRKNYISPKTIWKNKIIFYKKLNKLFFRKGRHVISNFLEFKKTLIQKQITKKLNSIIKKNWFVFFEKQEIKILLLNTGLFNSLFDIIFYIKNYGALVDCVTTTNPNTPVKVGSVFQVCSSIFLLKFIFKKKRKLIITLKKLKLYKFRVKINVALKHVQKSKWVDFDFWFLCNTVLFTSKTFDTEFMTKCMLGVFIQKKKLIDYVILYKQLNLTFYMNRSYNWKYII